MMDDNRMPSNTALELGVLSSALIDNGIVDQIDAILRPDDFSCPEYGLVYAHMQKMHADGKPIDVQTLREQLIRNHAPSTVTDTAFFKDLASAEVTSVHAEAYAEQIHELARRRRAIQTFEDLSRKAQDTNADDMIAAAEDRLRALTEAPVDLEPVSEQLVRMLKSVEAASQSEDGLRGLTTGFRDLDLTIGGLQDSHLVIVAGAPSMGKSALAGSMIRAQKPETKVLLFTLEMSAEEYLARLTSNIAGVDFTRLQRGTMDDDEWQRVIAAVSEIGKRRLTIYDGCGTTVSEIRRIARQAQVRQGVDVIFLDHVQILGSEVKGGGRGNMCAEITNASNALKALAKELRIPVVALSQLSRDIRKRDDHKPQLADLRDSGSLEQDADDVVMLHRESYYYDDSTDDTAMLYVRKCRNGHLGGIPVRWEPTMTRFVDYTPDERRVYTEVQQYQEAEAAREKADKAAAKEAEKAAKQRRQAEKDARDRELHEEQMKAAKELQEAAAKVKGDPMQLIFSTSDLMK